MKSEIDCHMTEPDTRHFIKTRHNALGYLWHARLSPPLFR